MAAHLAAARRLLGSGLWGQKRRVRVVTGLSHPADVIGPCCPMLPVTGRREWGRREILGWIRKQE